MGWLERFKGRPASYRDVPFMVEDRESRTGRRLVVHEFYRQRRRVIEDTGWKPRTYNLRAFIVGDDHDLQADALEAACAREGPGKLVHPDHGTLRVYCHESLRRGRTRDSRMTEFDLYFEEAEPLPEVEQAAGGQLRQLQRDAEDAEVAELPGEVEVEGPQSYRDAIADTLTSSARAVRNARVFQGNSTALDAIRKSTVNLINEAGRLATDPADAVAAVFDAVSQVRAAAGNARSAWFAYRALLDNDPDLSVAGVGGIAKQARRNRRRMLSCIRLAGLLYGAGSAVDVAWETSQEAREARAAWLDYADDLELDTDGAAGALDAISQARSIVLGNVPRPDQQLPELVTIVPDVGRPALVLAHDLYGPNDRSDDIVARNRIRHPLFVPAGVALEVIVDG